MQLPNLKGSDLEEQYINSSYLDKGGMGVVYKAYDNFNNIDVAIKLVAIPNPEEEELLFREVKISSELNSDNLVKTYYVGDIEITGTKYFYIVQHYYSNGNLATKIQKDIPLDVCLKMMIDILNGLKVAHSTIIHRDLKPANILIDENNSLVITDFGLAKFVDEHTKSKSFKGGGTGYYMSPECWLMEKNSIQMDIYSLGILFYELLTGELPLSPKTYEECRDWHLFSTLPDISLLRKDTPTKLKQIISKMTQKRATDRYSNSEEIISALEDTIKQEQEQDKEIEKLASLGHKKAEEIKTARLKAEQERQKKENYKKFLNFHVEELKNKVKTIIEKVNSRLEENKIILREATSYGESMLKDFTLSINGRSANFQFHSETVIEQYEQDRIEAIQDRVRQSGRGWMASPIGDSIFKKKDIIYLGMVETNYKNPVLGECFGFILALVKSDTDIYGKWYIASFSDSGFSPSHRKDFALNLNCFLKDFENSFSMHVVSVQYRELVEKDIYRVVEEIIGS